MAVVDSNDATNVLGNIKQFRGAAHIKAAKISPSSIPNRGSNTQRRTKRSITIMKASIPRIPARIGVIPAWLASGAWQIDMVRLVAAYEPLFSFGKNP